MDVHRFTVTVFFFILLGAWGAAFGNEPAEEHSAVITLAECMQFIEKQDGVLVDTRPPDIYRRGHLPGAVNLPLDDFEAGYERLRTLLELDWSQRIVTYCTSLTCEDSEKMREKLVEKGFSRVAVFKEGYAAWWKAKLPLEKGP